MQKENYMSWRRGAMGGGGGGQGGNCPPMICFCLSAQRSVMAMIIPLPHYDFFLFYLFILFIFFLTLSDLFQGWRKLFWARAAVAIHFCPPPPKQTPWRRP